MSERGERGDDDDDDDALVPLSVVEDMVRDYERAMRSPWYRAQHALAAAMMEGTANGRDVAMATLDYDTGLVVLYTPDDDIADRIDARGKQLSRITGRRVPRMTPEQFRRLGGTKRKRTSRPPTSG